MCIRDRLGSVTYAQLGLTEEQALAMEKAAGEENPDGVIGSDNLTEEDQKLILSRFMNSDNMKEEREETLVSYYTDIMKQSWDKKHQEVVNLYYADNPGAVKSVNIG